MDQQTGYANYRLRDVRDSFSASFFTLLQTTFGFWNLEDICFKTELQTCESRAVPKNSLGRSQEFFLKIFKVQRYFVTFLLLIYL